MPLDRSILGNMAAEQMTELEDTYGEQENATIVGAITIVYVARQVDDENVELAIRKRHNFGDVNLLMGVLENAKMQVLLTRLPGGGA
jgi:hypothetical protein